MSELTVKKPVDPANSGLEDVIAGDSSVCFIDGPRSRLIYRGYSIDDLAHNTSFEEVAYLLIFKKLPNKSQLTEFSATLASQRGLEPKFVERMTTIPKTAHSMAVLRTLVSALSFFDLKAEAVDEASCRDKAVKMIAQLPTVIAAWQRICNGEKPIEPKKNLSHAANFLYMLSGKDADPLFAQGLDLYLVLLADHELNASTFTARVTASTLSDFYSAITSAIGALKGPLHGGANEQVIKMLLEINDESKVDSWIQTAFEQKKKIMGFGHRVYKVKDPRSPILKEFSKKVCEKTGNGKLYRMSERIEEIVAPAKKLPSNVDFYSATVLYCIGIPPALFTPMFLMSRIAGYSAHYLEQISDNRLLRPRANYTGDMDLALVPIDKR
ncbi:MAG: citrate synthase [Elusimicrobia bacterium RIFCSPLOWO2_01_FULL_54_10]|nr:MAG: citrate synthase [Elusimicrobia bacterium RIFCSPLOWO2_01_FULL_54_10]